MGAYLETCLRYALRSKALGALLVVFALLMVAPAVIVPGEETISSASQADPVALFEGGERFNTRQAVADDSGLRGKREADAYRRLNSIADRLDDAAGEAERYDVLASYYEAKASCYEDGSLAPKYSTGYDSALDAQTNARRYRRLAEFGKARGREERLWWTLPGETPAFVYLAGAVAFQPSGQLDARFYSLPLALLAPQGLLHSNACLLWCAPAVLVAWRLARLCGWRRLVGQAPTGAIASLALRLAAAALVLPAFALAACVPAVLVAGIRNGLGSLLYPVTLVRDDTLIETTLGGILASQLVILVLMALVVAAVSELVSLAFDSPPLGAIAGALFCLVPLLPAYDLQARAGGAALAWLPQTYLNLRRVAGVPAETGDLSRELLFTNDSSGAVESVIHGATPFRAVLALGATVLACSLIALLVRHLRRPSLWARKSLTKGGAHVACD